MIDWERVVSGELRASSYCVRKVYDFPLRTGGEASFVAEIPEGTVPDEQGPFVVVDTSACLACFRRRGKER